MVSPLAGERPLMLAFEDVQWADRSTLDLIALLVAGASGRPLLLAFTARSDELHRGMEEPRLELERLLALVAWADAVAAWRAAGEPHPLGVALFRQAEALAADGDAPSAAAAAEEAAEIARRIGAAPLLGEVEALMRRARLRVATSAGQDDPDAPALGLTAREVDVLRLVADGFSNRQIADRLSSRPRRPACTCRTSSASSA